MTWGESKESPLAHGLRVREDFELESLQSKGLEAFREAARAVEEWPVYKTSSPEIAAALGMSHSPGFAVGTTFGFNKGVFKSVTSLGHKAFSGGLPTKEGILTFLKIEQLPPYLPYSTATNGRVFAMERQARMFISETPSS